MKKKGTKKIYSQNIVNLSEYRESKKVKVPVVLESINAGLLSENSGHVDSYVEIDPEFIKNSRDVRMYTVTGSSMEPTLYAGDILLVDTSIQTTYIGKIVIASVDGSLTVKRVSFTNNKFYLSPDNPAYTPIEIKKVMDFRVIGVVIGINIKD